MTQEAERNIMMHAGGESTTFEIPLTPLFITCHIFQYASNNYDSAVLDFVDKMYFKAARLAAIN